MKKITLIVTALIFGAFSSLASAQEMNSRKGFFIDGGLGVGYESEQLDEYGFAFGLQLGAGLNEQVLLYADLQGMATSQNDINYTLSQTLFKVQYFPQAETGLYLNAGIGVGMAKASTEISGATLSADSDPGLSLEGGVGYQFRFGRGFYLAPEFINNYSRIEGENVWISALDLRLGWYF